jgi:hypothetical protein
MIQTYVTLSGRLHSVERTQVGMTEMTRKFFQRYKGPYNAVFWVVRDGIAKPGQPYWQTSLAVQKSDC